MAEFHVHQSPEAHYTVYQLVLPDGKKYIGCTGKSLKERYRFGYDHNQALYREITRIGRKNLHLEPLCEKLTETGAHELEARFIELFQTRDPRYGYNCFTGGSRNGARAADRTRRKDREISKQRAACSSCAFAKGVQRHRVPVRCVETREEFPSLGAAGRHYHVDWSGILRACKKPHLRSAGLHWEYIFEEEAA